MNTQTNHQNTTDKPKGTTAMTTQQFETQKDYLQAIETEILDLMNNRALHPRVDTEPWTHVCVAQFSFDIFFGGWHLRCWQFVDGHWECVDVRSVPTEGGSLIGGILTQGLQDFAALWWKLDDFEPMFRMHYVFGWCVLDHGLHSGPDDEPAVPFAGWTTEDVWNYKLQDLIR